MMLEAPPPRRHISSAPISLDAASAILEKYLTNSETYPHLHPDATITPEGVAFNAQGGAMGNPIMHHLRRVAAGMRGEYQEPERALDEEDDQQNATTDVTVTSGRKGGLKKSSKTAAVAEGEWQDLAEYQAEQGDIEIGEIGDRTNVVQEGGEEPQVQSTKGKDKKRTNAQVEEQGPADGAIDKEARKRAKKERDQQRKKEKAAKGKSKE
ncbi:hypothetical protein J4E91_004030 [Alternaria rosae]|uniref:uncharacterized protein n=1 Tax=Alternaria rosae TaxID=1187941 RepID=UPI001E8E5CD3|nr:uncharacterized protein BKA58DRAFT_214758 [Alternaria rosae]KAH6866954.1 hypothetical protein BKA58DRAFT_214758 [Alternaria rosae]KAI4951321.1 hypothetical protein J4E91_004030 [Alternaria rosae]